MNSSNALPIHQNIKDKLKYFYDSKKIPNIIFNGSSGSGKSSILNDFISLIYDHNKDKIKNFVMYVNCAHGKGIKFIRDELKFFAKTHIHSNEGDTFKSIILFNGDKLTMDAQSALRRCIELFSHNTRFFIVVEDKYKLLKPILSRFCEIYIPEPEIDNTVINLYKHNITNTYHLDKLHLERTDKLQSILNKFKNKAILQQDVMNLVNKLYEKAYSCLDIIDLLNNDYISLNIKKKYQLLVAFDKVRREIRNEKILLFFILNFIFLDVISNLDNISFL